MGDPTEEAVERLVWAFPVTEDCRCDSMEDPPYMCDQCRTLAETAMRTLRAAGWSPPGTAVPRERLEQKGEHWNWVRQEAEPLYRILPEPPSDAGRTNRRP